MRESVGSTFIFMLAISFTLIFSGFLILAINYNRAYKIKNEITSMVERYEGLTGSDALISTEKSKSSKVIDNSLGSGGSINIINTYLANNNYSATGLCEVGDYAIKDITTTYTDDQIKDGQIKVTESTQNEKYYYCIKYTQDNNNCVGYFTITVFFDFNLPIVGNISKFNVTGQTNNIYPVYLGGNNSVISQETCKK